MASDLRKKGQLPGDLPIGFPRGSADFSNQSVPPNPDVFNTGEICFSVRGPGVGKSTQCSRVAQEIYKVHFSPGDLLPPSLLCDLIDSRMRRGELVRGDIILSSLQRSTQLCVKESG